MAATKYNWNLSGRLPGPKATALLRSLREDNGHFPKAIAEAGYMSAPNLYVLRRFGWDVEAAREEMRREVRNSNRRARGTPLGAPVRPMGVPVLSTILAGLTVSEETGCWTLPTRELGAFGYAVLQDPSTKERVRLHVWVATSSPWMVEGQHLFETCEAPVVHHHCRNRGCFYPEHLQVFESDEVHRQHHMREAVKQGGRMVGAGGESSYSYRSHCKRGHALHGPGSERRSGGDCAYCHRINANYQAERAGKVRIGAGARSVRRESQKYEKAMSRDLALLDGRVES